MILILCSIWCVKVNVNAIPCPKFKVSPRSGQSLQHLFYCCLCIFFLIISASAKCVSPIKHCCQTIMFSLYQVTKQTLSIKMTTFSTIFFALLIFQPNLSWSRQSNSGDFSITSKPSLAADSTRRGRFLTCCSQSIDLCRPNCRNTKCKFYLDDPNKHLSYN